jgi:hypothetical protein
MNSFEQIWNRLTTAAREALAGEIVAAAPGAWITRVAALGRAEITRSRQSVVWTKWAMPGLGVSLLIAMLAIVALNSTTAQPEGTAELIALADPLAGNSLLP